MQRQHKKMMAILLALLLGLSPLQTLVAGIISSSATDGGMHRISNMQDSEMAGKDRHVGGECDKCNDANGCHGHDCFSAQCAYCMGVALLPDFSYPIHRAVGLNVTRPDRAYPTHPFSSLFRPPRV